MVTQRDMVASSIRRRFGGGGAGGDISCGGESIRRRATGAHGLGTAPPATRGTGRGGGTLSPAGRRAAGRGSHAGGWLTKLSRVSPGMLAGELYASAYRRDAGLLPPGIGVHAEPRRDPEPPQRGNASWLDSIAGPHPCAPRALLAPSLLPVAPTEHPGVRIKVEALLLANDRPSSSSDGALFVLGRGAEGA